MAKGQSAVIAAIATDNLSVILREFKTAASAAKSAKASKKDADLHVFTAYCANFCLMAEEGLFDADYGKPDYRNTTTGPAYRARLQSGGLTEAKAKLLWELGNLGYQMIDGLSAILDDAAKRNIRSVASLLKKADLDSESALRKFLLS
jgi:hypothetical protein